MVTFGKLFQKTCQEMEHVKYEIYMKERERERENNYGHCSICANYRNINSFAHRKSEHHQKKLEMKLRKISYHLSQKRKSLIFIHDEYWPDKDCKRFCHFCGDTYSEHQIEDTFTIECLGSLHHHSSPRHVEAVKTFLKQNFSKGAYEKFCVEKDCLDRFLAKIPYAKTRYTKKMDILNNMIIQQIRNSEDERKRIVSNEHTHTQQAQSSFIWSTQNLTSGDSINCKGKETHLCMPMLKNEKKRGGENKDLPPWLEDSPSESSGECGIPENLSGASVYGPTIDTLMKHVENQKKKGLSKNRIGADFKHHTKSSTKWLPSFQGVWNQGRRKQMKFQFNRKNKTY